MSDDILKLEMLNEKGLNSDEIRNLTHFREYLNVAATFIPKANREYSIVKTKLEEASMWFSKGMYRGE